MATPRDGGLPSVEDPRAFAALVREHEGWLRGVVYAVTGRLEMIDDILQQVWVRACQQARTLRDASRLRSWLFRIARNAAIDALRSARRRRYVPIEEVRGSLARSEAESPQGRLLRDELHAQLLRAVESLPARYREPFVLRHLQDLSYAEIGELLGLPRETVETRLVRARRLLREMLDGSVEP